MLAFNLDTCNFPPMKKKAINASPFTFSFFLFFATWHGQLVFSIIIYI